MKTKENGVNKMNKIKRLSALVMLLIFVFSLGACGKTAEAKDDVITRVGSLKGPTTMGLANFISECSIDENAPYTFTMETQADVLLGEIAQGNLDIALVPANVAAILYKKTEGGVKVININTLGVLYMVSGDESINDIKDLEGKTVYLTGLGTTPDLVLRYLLLQNGMDENSLTLEYKSEATEVAAMLAENPEAVGLLPQPFVTAALLQNEELSIVMDMTEKWDEKSENGSMMVTGVTIATTDYIENHPGALKAFMDNQKASVEKAESDVTGTADIIVALGIVEKAPVASMALPYCNIVFITGDEMKNALTGYYGALYEMDPSSVGGEVPDDAFYYLGY